MDDDKPSAREIVFNSYQDTLYTHAFKVGQPDEGKFFNIVTRDDGSQEATLELTPRVRISFVFIKEKNAIESVEIAKFRKRKNTNWFPESSEHVRLSPITFERLLGFISFLSQLDLADVSARRVRLAEDLPNIDVETRRRVVTLLARKDGNQIIEEVLRNGMVGSRDIVNVGYRKNQLGVFRRLLDDGSFLQQYKADEHVAQAGTEAVWQHFFERNTWIFGYGLNYVWCNNLTDKQLEQVVKGADFNAVGKRTDALLRTAAQVSQFVLVEIKTPQAPLLAATPPRPGVWAPSSDVAAGVAQIQKTVSAFKRQYFEKADLVDEEGNPLGEDVYNYAPRSYLLIGTLAQFDTGKGLNKEKYASFQLLRRSLTDPEVLTFDELYERAAAIVGHSERSL